MGTLLAGRTIAQEMNALTKREINELQLNTGSTPTLAIITANTDCSLKLSEIRLHADLATRLGVNVKEIIFDNDIDENSLLMAINNCNNDSNIHGILVLLPLPDHVNSENILLSISPKKELEGLSQIKDLTTVFKGKQICILSSVLILLKNINYDILSKRNIFLIDDDILQSNPVVTKLLSLTSNLNIPFEIISSNNEISYEISAEADLLLVSVSKPESIDKKYIKDGAIVIDFNSTIVGEEYSEEKGRNIPILKSSLNIDSVLEKASYVDPASGGVGPVALAILMRNFIHNWKGSLGLHT